MIFEKEIIPEIVACLSLNLTPFTLLFQRGKVMEKHTSTPQLINLSGEVG